MMRFPPTFTVNTSRGEISFFLEDSSESQGDYSADGYQCSEEFSSYGASIQMTITSPYDPDVDGIYECEYDYEIFDAEGNQRWDGGGTCSYSPHKQEFTGMRIDDYYLDDVCESLHKGIKKMKLWTKEMDKLLDKYPLYSDNKTVIARYFSLTGWTWYATEVGRESDDIIFYGYVNGLEGEWGYFSLSQLEELGYMVERDLYMNEGKTVDEYLEYDGISKSLHKDKDGKDMIKGRGIVTLNVDNILHNDFDDLDGYMRSWHLYPTAYMVGDAWRENGAMEAIRVYEMDEDYWMELVSAHDDSQWEAGDAIALVIQEDLAFDQSYPENEVIVHMDRASWKTFHIRMKFHAYSEDLQTDDYSENEWVTASTRKSHLAKSQFEIGQRYYSDFMGAAYLHCKYEVINRSEHYITFRMDDGTEYRRKMHEWENGREAVTIGAGEYMTSDNTMDNYPYDDDPRIVYCSTRKSFNDMVNQQRGKRGKIIWRYSNSRF